MQLAKEQEQLRITDMNYIRAKVGAAACWVWVLQHTGWVLDCQPANYVLANRV
jgi:hypothetical protein